LVGPPGRLTENAKMHKYVKLKGACADRLSPSVPAQFVEMKLCSIRLPVVLLSAWAVAGIVGSPRPAAADALDEIHRRGTLIWGGDQEGGGPYVYPDEKDPKILRGFEVELAEMLAGELHVKAQFQQGQWDKLPLLLDGTIDVVLNGYELTATRQRDYLCTRPYYVYGLQLLVRREGPIRVWSALANPSKRMRVGALTGSAAETFLRGQARLNIEVIGYDGSTDAMQHVVNGVLDATVQDDCAATFYLPRFPDLQSVGGFAGAGYYVALVGKDETRLHAALNEALDRIIADGRVKSLYDRWHLGGEAQTLALSKATAPTAAAAQVSFLDLLYDDLPILLEAAGMTIFLSVISMPLAIGIGILVAIGRLYGRWLIAKPLGLYVELLRGTPLMLQLYAIFFLLPKIGIALPALAAAILGLAINYSAYEAEIYRAGLQAIPRGQMEAALSLGMSRGLAIRRIILPQAFRIVIPPVTNDFIALFKDTSVCSVVTVVELTKRYSILALSTGAIVELAAITSILYLMMSYPLSLFARWSERRLAEGKTRE
jgi:polar amino acid transport system substrate-binding protein